MNAPISRVLPTPVARAKQTDGNSRSKSVTVGHSALIGLEGDGGIVALLQRGQLGDAVQDLQRVALRGTQTEPAGDGVDLAMHRRQSSNPRPCWPDGGGAGARFATSRL